MNELGVDQAKEKKKLIDIHKENAVSVPVIPVLKVREPALILQISQLMAAININLKANNQMTREEKRLARIDRYRDLSANARKQSGELFQRSSRMGEAIPFGQPILVGHHSERWDRNYRNKIHNTMGKSVEADKKADYYERKAEAAENNNAIYLEDEDSIQKLEAKVEKLTMLQECMKTANKIIRDKKLAEIVKIDQLKELGFSEKSAIELITPRRGGSLGFETYQLSNNNACLRNAKQRLEKAIKLKTTESKESEINGVRIVENTEENRLQLFFPGKPDDDVRSKLKHNGFRWSPSNECWQSYLNRYQIDRAKSIIDQI